MATRVAMVLGGGGAKGYAHVGVLEVLAERGFELAGISGTSMGALVGGVAAVGKLPEYTEWALSLSQREVLRLLDPVLPSSAAGVFRAERVISRVAEIVGDVHIEDLPIPYTAVATDLTAQREVWFSHGPLMTAIRASIAIPSVITPIVVNGRLLCDGGVLNPVPVEPTIGMHADVTIAVSLSGTRRAPLAPIHESSEARPTVEWVEWVRRGLMENDLLRPLFERLSGDSAAVVEELRPYHHPTALSVIDLSMLSLDTMSAMIERFRAAAQPPDITIRVPRDVCGTLDFHRAAEVIATGRHLAEEALDAWSPPELNHRRSHPPRSAPAVEGTEEQASLSQEGRPAT